MPVRDQAGLKPADERFAAHLAKGMYQTDAYRKSHDCTGVAPQRIAERASKLAAKPGVKARVQELLREAKVLDIDSVGEAHKAILDAIERASEAKNWTALSSLLKTRAQILGMIKDSMVIAPAEGLSDAQLIDRLAGGDAAKAAMVKKMLGKDDEYVQ